MSKLTEKFVTQCPNCHKNWSVKPGKFTLAAGKVKCAACGTLFDAQKHRQSKVNWQSVTQGKTSLTPLPRITQNQAFSIASLAKAPSAQNRSYAQEFNKKRNPKMSGKFNYSLTAFLVLFALVQLAFFNRESGYQSHELKPLYSKIYQLLNIQPAASMIFQQQSLSVIPDLNHNNVLVMMFEFKNTDLVPQPLPSVEVKFSDLQGRLISKRVFTASDYSTLLNPPSSSLSADQSIKGTLSILKPADRALNYELRLIYP